VGIAFACVMASSTSLAATKGPTIEKGTRIGVVNLLGAELLHYHVGKEFKDSFLKFQTVSWPVDDMLNTTVGDSLGRIGLEPVPVAATETLKRVREDCFVNAALVKGLPKVCSPALVETAAATGVKYLIVMAPGLNTPDHTGSRQNEDGLSERLRGWGFYTVEHGGPRHKPTVFNETELLLIDITPAGATLTARQWGGLYKLKWESFTDSTDPKSIPADEVNGLQSMFAGILSRQTADLLDQIEVTGPR
jgi:hypothetical protein